MKKQRFIALYAAPGFFNRRRGGDDKADNGNGKAYPENYNEENEGVQQEDAVSETQKRKRLCGACGSEMDETEAFCPCCGARVREAEMQTVYGGPDMFAGRKPRKRGNAQKPPKYPRNYEKNEPPVSGSGLMHSIYSVPKTRRDEAEIKLVYAAPGYFPKERDASDNENSRPQIAELYAAPPIKDSKASGPSFTGVYAAPGMLSGFDRPAPDGWRNTSTPGFFIDEIIGGPGESAPPNPKKGRFCPECGAPAGKGFKFCPECGMRLPVESEGKKPGGGPRPELV